MDTRVAIYWLFSSFLFNSVFGSTIELNSSVSNLKPLLTTNMTLRCSLKDSAPSSNVIGKRSVDDLTTANKGQGGDVSKRAAVTHTDDNMQHALTMVVTRDGVDLASINSFTPAKVAAGLSGFEVSGQLNNGGNSGELGYLELHWSHPSLSEAGTYKCESSALSSTGHDVDFSQTLEVNAGDVTMPDLVNYLHQLIVDKENKDEMIAQQNKTVAALTQELTSLKTDFNSQKAELTALKANTAAKTDFNSLEAELTTLKANVAAKTDFNSLEAELTTLKANVAAKTDLNSLEAKFNSLSTDFTTLKAVARQEPDIFFTAGISSGTPSISGGATVIYDKIYVNEGASYSNSTGVFTAPVAGFYRFEVYALDYGASHSILRIQVNGVETVNLWCYGSSGNKNYDNAASNSLTTHLSRGDKVEVVSRSGYTSQLSTYYSGHPDNTFSGQILSLD